MISASTICKWINEFKKNNKLPLKNNKKIDSVEATSFYYHLYSLDNKECSSKVLIDMSDNYTPLKIVIKRFNNEN